MTVSDPLSRLPLPARAADLHLRPVGLLGGRAAAAAVAAGQARRLAGGPLAFAAVELRGGHDAGAAGAVYPLAALAGLGWPQPLHDRVARLLDAAAAPRPAWAGLDLRQPLIMGVVNVTPDSFSDGGRHLDRAAALAHGRALLAAGADILDVGGESTRPGAEPVPLDEELRRVVPVVEALAGEGAVVSVDTRHAAVMRAALAAGARIVNDITALAGDPESLATAAAAGCAVVLMHMQGEPRTMQEAPRYRDVTLDVADHLAARIAACEAAGVPRSRIAVDPGIGFGKHPIRHNLPLLDEVALLHTLGVPLLVGASRKRFIATLSCGEPPERRVAGSVAAALAAMERGVQLHRAHDVAELAQARAVWAALNIPGSHF
jgi:dihydropteroate synthase